MTDEKNTADPIAGAEPTESETISPTATARPTPDSDTQQSRKPKAETPPRKATPPRPPSAGSSAWLAWLLLALLILAAGWGGLILWQQQDEQQQQVDELRSRLDRQQGQWDAQSDHYQRSLQQALSRQQETQTQALAEVRQQVEATSRRLVELSATTREDWKLAEAEYLLRLAEQRLVVERNSVTALAMARAADDLLRELDDRALFPIRQALTREISTLVLQNPIDREGLYLQLAALIEQVEGLSTVQQPSLQQETSEPIEVTEAEPSEPQSWRERIKASFSNLRTSLSNHLRIRRHDQPALSVVLAPEQQVYLNQNLRLMLEQAQSALLREETLVYQTSLARAQDWLDLYYALNPQAMRLKNQLAELAEQPVHQSLPGLGEALRLLKQHIEQRHRLSGEGDA